MLHEKDRSEAVWTTCHPKPMPQPCNLWLTGNLSPLRKTLLHWTVASGYYYMLSSCETFHLRSIVTQLDAQQWPLSFQLWGHRTNHNKHNMSYIRESICLHNPQRNVQVHKAYQTIHSLSHKRAHIMTLVTVMLWFGEVLCHGKPVTF